MTNLIKPDTDRKSDIEKKQSVPLGFEIFIDGISDRVKDIILNIFQSKEVQALSNFTENNPWHDNENVLNHVEVVFANLQILLSGVYVAEEYRQKLLKYLSQKPFHESELTRSELLLIACALHDISKGQPRPEDDEVAPGQTYLYIKDDGTTSGKGHEHASSLLVSTLLGKSGLTKAEISHIAYLVENHDQYSLDYTNSNLSGFKGEGSVENDVIQVKNSQPNHAIELILHIVADEWGAQVSQWKSEYLLDKIVPRLL